MAWPSVVQAAPERCGDYDDTVAQLEAKFDEVQRVRGITSRGLRMEIFASRRTGTWTLLVTNPNGKTCLVDAGDHFDVIQQLAGHES